MRFQFHIFASCIAATVFSTASYAQDALTDLPEMDDTLKAAFNLDYRVVIKDAAAALETDMDSTIQCAGDLLLHSMANKDETSASVYISLAEVYMERGSLLRKNGEDMPKSAKRWMKIKKWTRGVPDSFDAYGEPRFAVLDAAGQKAFVGNAETCREAINAVMSEEETSALALHAVMGSLF